MGHLVDVRIREPALRKDTVVRLRGVAVPVPPTGLGQVTWLGVTPPGMSSACHSALNPHESRQCSELPAYTVTWVGRRGDQEGRR